MANSDWPGYQVDFIEIHGAHGYLVYEFLSPLSDKRADAYGGDLPNWIRFLLCLVKRVREVSVDKLFLVVISATDWAEGAEKGDDGEWKQCGIEQKKPFAGELKSLGVDLVDMSSGGNRVQQKIPWKHGYQVPLAAGLKAGHPDLLKGSRTWFFSPRVSEKPSLGVDCSTRSCSRRKACSAVRTSLDRYVGTGWEVKQCFVSD